MARFDFGGAGLAKLAPGVTTNEKIDVCIRIDVARYATCCFPA
jgi:hypothetical protein